MTAAVPNPAVTRWFELVVRRDGETWR